MAKTKSDVAQAKSENQVLSEQAESRSSMRLGGMVNFMVSALGEQRAESPASARDLQTAMACRQIQEQNRCGKMDIKEVEAM